MSPEGKKVVQEEKTLLQKYKHPLACMTLEADADLPQVLVGSVGGSLPHDDWRWGREIICLLRLLRIIDMSMLAEILPSRCDEACV